VNHDQSRFAAPPQQFHRIDAEQQFGQSQAAAAQCFQVGRRPFVVPPPSASFASCAAVSFSRREDGTVLPAGDKAVMDSSSPSSES
jgi:hypothetical protein